MGWQLSAGEPFYFHPWTYGMRWYTFQPRHISLLSFTNLFYIVFVSIYVQSQSSNCYSKSFDCSQLFMLSRSYSGSVIVTTNIGRRTLMVSRGAGLVGPLRSIIASIRHVSFLVFQAPVRDRRFVIIACRWQLIRPRMSIPRAPWKDFPILSFIAGYSRCQSATEVHADEQRIQ